MLRWRSCVENTILAESAGNLRSRACFNPS
jgi:hypothetical protein